MYAHTAPPRTCHWLTDAALAGLPRLEGSASSCLVTHINSSNSNSSSSRRRPQAQQDVDTHSALAPQCLSHCLSLSAQSSTWAAHATHVSGRLARAAHRRLQCLNNSVKQLMCGAGSAIVSRTMLAPLERIKMEVLLNQDVRTWTDAITHIYGKGGIGGFWKGNVLNCIRTAPFRAINYAVFDKLHSATRDCEAVPSASARFLAGAGAGVTATLICFPLDVIRTRMMIPPHDTPLFATIRGIVRTDGLVGFYTGCAPATVSMAIGGAVFYGVYDLLKTRHLRIKGRPVAEADAAWYTLDLSPQHTLLFGGLSGMCAEIVTYPLEVVRRKMQLDCVLTSRAATLAALQGQGVPVPVVRLSFTARLMRAVQLSVAKHGVRGLYAGMPPNLLQVLPSSAISYLIYESARKLLDVQ